MKTDRSGYGVYVSLSELISLRAQSGSLPLLSHSLTQNPHAGNARSQQRGQGMEFVEVRPYLPGDDVRNIDWRVTARYNKPYTKLHAEERERPVYIAVDQRVNMFFGSNSAFKSVIAAQVAALIAWTAMANGDRVGGLVASGTLTKVRTGRNRSATLQLINAISKANCALNARSQTSVELTQLLEDSLLHSSDGASVVVISDFFDLTKASVKAIQVLGRSRSLLLIRTVDPLETAMPPIGRVNISNGQQQTTINLSSRARRQFQQDADLTVEELKHCVQSCGARMITISTEDDPVQRLRETS